MLVQEILHKIQFRYNQSRLDELDDESLDDDVRDISSSSVALITFLSILFFLQTFINYKENQRDLLDGEFFKLVDSIADRASGLEMFFLRDNAFCGCLLSTCR